MVLILKLFFLRHIQTPHLFDICPEVLQHIRRIQYLHPPAETEQPAKEQVTDFNLCDHNEVLVIYGAKGTQNRWR